MSHDAIEKEQDNIIREFNRNPKGGVKILKNICEENNLDVTKELGELFLNEGAFSKKLNLDHVGNFLGSKENENVMTYFIEQIDIERLSFEDGMYEVFSKFNLPKEAEKISRLVEGYSASYCIKNGIISQDQDKAYSLALAIMQLNDNLHNPEIKKEDKISLEKFNEAVRDIDKDLSPRETEAIYKKVKEKPINLKFVENAPGYTIQSNKLNNDPAYKEIKDIFKDSKVRGNVIKDSMEAKVDKPKSWLTKFTGYEGKMTVKDKDGASATIELYQPNIFSRWFLGEKSKIIIQPGHEKDQLDKKNIQFAAGLTASFNTEAKDIAIAATYHYLKEDLKNAYVVAKVGMSNVLSPDFKKTQQENPQHRESTISNNSKKYDTPASSRKSSMSI